MKKIVASLLLLASMVSRADTFSLFSPSDGILVGDSDTYITTSAVSADVRALWSGTCDASSFLRGDGACTAVPADPPAGSDTQVQYNNAGVFGASANFTWNNGTGILAVSSDVTVGGQSVCLENGTNCQPQVTPAGSDTQIQFNNAGAFGASANFTWDDSTSTLSVLSGSADAALNITSPGSSVAVVNGDIVSSLQLISASESNLTLTGPTTAYIALGNGSNNWYIELEDPDLTFLSGPGPTENIRFTPTDIQVGGDSVCLEDGTNCPGGGTLVAAGANTQVQYNNSGNFGASANFTFNSGTNTLTATNLAGAGSGLTALNATQLTSGTVPDARFPATLPAVSGANLTNLNATNISSGTLADARLSSNVPLKNAANTFTAPQSITSNGQALVIDSPSISTYSTWAQGGTPYGYLGDRTGVIGSGTGMSIRSDGTLYFASGGATERGSISAAGNWTINAPASGTAAIVSGLGGSLTQAWASSGAASLLGAGWNVGLAANEWNLVSQSTDPLSVGTSGSAALGLWTASVRRLNIGSSGNVTINAPSSGNSLSVSGVAGGVATAITQAAGDYAMTVTDGTSTFGLYNASQTRMGTNSNHGLAIYTNGAGNDRLTISAAGNVTINAPSSGTALTVNGNQLLVASSASLQLTDGTISSYFANTASINYLGTFSSHPTEIYTNSLQRVVVSSAGNVTINTPTSGNTLTLGANSGNNAISVNDGTASWYVRTSGASGTTLGNSTNHPLSLLTNNTNRITIGSGGGVQVGAPTGGDQGAGTLNTAGSIYTNGALISPMKMVSGYCSSSGTPGCADIVGYGGAGGSYSSSGGTGQITISLSGFTDPGSGLGVQCTATSTRGVSSPSFVEMTSSSYTFANFVTRNTTTGTAENQSFRFICTGP